MSHRSKVVFFGSIVLKIEPTKKGGPLEPSALTRSKVSFGSEAAIQSRSAIRVNDGSQLRANRSSRPQPQCAGVNSDRSTKFRTLLMLGSLCMTGIFSRLFLRDPPFDEKAEARKLLHALPPCSKFVVIACPKYSHHYRCEVVMAARDLLAFAERARESTFGGTYASRTAREALPEWLRNAADSDSTSYMPLDFAAEVQSYVLNFIHDRSAKVFCPDCKSYTDSMVEKRSNERSYGPSIEPTSEHTSTWECPVGHHLYEEHHKFRFHMRPDA